MKRFLIITLVLASVATLGLGALFASPYYFYNRVVTENYRTKWFFLEDYNKDLIAPQARVELREPALGNEDLWQKFHLKDIVIPLPVKNPLYYAAPLITYDKKSNHTRLGVSIYGTDLREISKLYVVNNAVMGSEIRSQELFKLPLAKKIIKSAGASKIWEDIFSKDLGGWNIPFSEMVYNLYILHLRSKLLPSGFIGFGALDASTGVVRLRSKNKDYITELVMTRDRGVVYSYILVTQKNNAESEVLRYKFLRDIDFRPGSESLAGIVYKEFQALPYERKIDHEGMLYLYSAWSHQISNKAFLKEMVFYLERGSGNEKQLKPLYEYASFRYGKTFSQKLVDSVELDPEMALKRNIELERRDDLRELSESKTETTPSLTPEERLRRRIQEAKKKKVLKEGRMILD